MHQPSTYLDTVACEIRGADALAAVRSLRSLYHALTGRQSAHPHHPHQHRLATLPRFEASTWKRGAPLCARFSLAWLDDDARRRFVAALHDAGARVLRLDVAVDLPFGSPLPRIVDRPAARWHRPRSCAARYVDGLDDDVSFCSYADRPSKLAPDGAPVLHVEVRLQADAVPIEIRRDVRALLNVDPDALARRFMRPKRPHFYSPSDRVLAALRWRASDRGFITASFVDLAKLSDTPVRTVRDRISALALVGSLDVLQRRRGRGHRSRYRLRI